eukprot:TRINITY_DN12478_c0_g1_i1.p1 TRINITY_DN12478_c0_g1~~TRINITY_DN12478_c0_g1_i1.p1  ORF type:complete len:431 (+),score=64.34 TRINITY_DN12478_c0_g1_i1:64-1356(+)
MTYLSDTETESDDSRELPQHEDEHVMNVADCPEDDKFKNDRRILDCLDYLGTLFERGVLEENVKMEEGELSNDIYVSHAALKELGGMSTEFVSNEPRPSFAIMDFEGMSTSTSATCLEGTVVICVFDRVAGKYDVADELHFHFKTPGSVLVEPVTAPSPLDGLPEEQYKKKMEDYATARSTLCYNITHIHGLPMSLGGYSVKGATNYYVKTWNDISSIMDKHSCSIVVTKGEDFDQKMLAWILYKARQTDPSLPNKLPYTSAGSYDIYKGFYLKFLPKVAGRPVMEKPIGISLLPGSLTKTIEADSELLLEDPKKHICLNEKWETFKKAHTLFSDMNTQGSFVRNIPHRFIQPSMAVKVARIHEVPFWYASACEFHEKAEPVFLNRFFDEDDEGDKPPHIHCSRRDAMSFASAVCCLVNACQTYECVPHP